MQKSALTSPARLLHGCCVVVVVVERQVEEKGVDGRGWFVTDGGQEVDEGAASGVEGVARRPLAGFERERERGAAFPWYQNSRESEAEKERAAERAGSDGEEGEREKSGGEEEVEGKRDGGERRKGEGEIGENGERCTNRERERDGERTKVREREDDEKKL